MDIAIPIFDGLTALDIVKAARGYAMRVRAVSLQENDFRNVTLPAIVHWEFNHYLIVERWMPKYVDLVDPASGRRRRRSRGWLRAGGRTRRPGPTRAR